MKTLKENDLHENTIIVFTSASYAVFPMTMANKINMVL
jgi:hypothetical protein